MDACKNSQVDLEGSKSSLLVFFDQSKRELLPGSEEIPERCGSTEGPPWSVCLSS